MICELFWTFQTIPLDLDNTSESSNTATSTTVSIISSTCNCQLGHAVNSIFQCQSGHLYIDILESGIFGSNNSKHGHVNNQTQVITTMKIFELINVSQHLTGSQG